MSRTEVWDPFHAGTLLSQLNEQRLAGPTPFCDITLIAANDTKFSAHKSVLAACSPYFQQLLSPSALTPPPPPHPVASLGKDRVLELPHLQPKVLSDLLDYIYTSRVSQRCAKGTKRLSEAGRSLGVPFLAGLVVGESNQMKSKSGLGKINGMEETDKADAAKSARTPHCFPLGTVFPSLVPKKHCTSSHSPSSSPVYMTSSEESQWKMAASVDSQLHRLPKRPESSPSPSSLSPIDLTAPARKDSRSSPASSMTSASPQFQSLPPPPHPGQLLVYPKKGMGDSFPAGVDSEHSTAETAQILFNMSTAAFQGHRPAEPEQCPSGKQGRPGSPSMGSGLPQLDPVPQSCSPPPMPPSSDQTEPKPELLCGVCHRLFSSASSLTVHMRLHRGGRALSCRHCGKAFIHNKRLQSHEAVCRQAPPILPVQTKQEPLEEGEEEAARGGETEDQSDQARVGPGRPVKKGRGFLGRHHRSFPRVDILAEEDHFVKVVDGHIIYFCAVCERSYMTLSSLKRHSNVHSWRRKYPCRFCDKVFALAEYRTKHEVWHTGERRYQCIFCWEAFATYYNLKTHQKALHGISPGLISSEKTANGGYKQKANALKLYRLLPMRSQKRPYKTYSQTLADSLLLPPDSAMPLPLPLDCSLPTSLGPDELCSLMGDDQRQDLQPDPANFPFRLGSGGLDQGETSKVTSASLDKPAEDETSKEDSVGSSSSNLELPKGNSGSKAAVSSVITYGHPKPSVIVHGTAVSSSVIVHSNQITSGVGTNFHSSSSPEPGNSQLSPKATHRPMKKHMLKEYIQAQRQGLWEEEGSATTENLGSTEAIDEEEKGRHPKGRKAHSKSITYMAKPACMTGVSEVRGVAPLCQITVRIGEEAIVKRRISETDLMRDKSPPPSTKSRKTDPVPQDATEPKHAHHHHHRHRHRPHRDTSKQLEVETKKKNQKPPKSPSKVREYYFRQEVREEDSDQDTEDNLWRPYYTYKPKRKTLHVQRVKKSSWHRKLRYKRSLRLMKRAEKIMDHSIKEEDEEKDDEDDEDEGDDDDDEDDDEGVDDEENEGMGKEGVENRHSVDIRNTSPISTNEQQGWDTKNKKSDCGLSPTLTPAQVFPKVSCPSPIRQDRHEPMGHSPECGTCGRRFSTTRKRDKHELTHLLEFVCLLCRETFSSQARLEKHQRAQHIAPEQSSSALQNRDLDPEMEIERVGQEKGSPGRVGRRPSVRHACPHCSKVCKTAAALGRHAKLHESGSPAAEEDSECGALAPEKEMPPPGTTDSDMKTEYAQSIPVISYPASVSQANGSSDAKTANFEHPGKAEAEPQNLGSRGSSEHRNNGLATDRNPSPRGEPSCSLTGPSSNLQSVLVLKGKESIDTTHSFRTQRERSPEGKDSQRNSPAQKDKKSDTSPDVAMRLQARMESAAAAPITMAAGGRGGVVCTGAADQEIESNLSRGVKRLHREMDDSRVAQNLRATALSKSPNPSQAQDLTMPSVVMRERELTQQAKANTGMDQREVTLLVPKQEVETPEYSVAQTTVTSTPQKALKSPRCSPHATDLLARVHLEASPSPRVGRASERPLLLQPPFSSRANDRPSAHALLLPRAPPPETKAEEDTSVGSHGEAGYPVQEFPLPLIVPGGCRSSKKHEDNILVSYPASPIPFGPLGKMVANGDLAKLPFYPDPYQLLYGPQLLPYPYSLAALPMALNMMAPGDKVEPLPFLPALLNYGANPYVGAVPHPLVANPSHYGNSSGSGKKRDSSNP